MKYIKILVVALLAMIAFSANAQYFLDQYAVCKAKDGQVLVRWEPKTMEDWNTGMSKGYHVEVFQSTNNQGYELLERQLVKPGDNNAWADSMTRVTDTLVLKFYEGVHNLMNVTEEYYSNISEIMASSNKRASADTFRLGMIVYSSSFDFKIAKLSGMGCSFKYQPNKKYKVKIYTETSLKRDTITAQIDPAVKMFPFPELEAEFGNKKVKLKWDTKPFKKFYFGYYIEKGFDEHRLKKVDPMPFINIFDMKGDTTVKQLQQEIKLDTNYRNYWVRLIGLDYFGDVSEKHTTIRGYGFIELEASPNIIKATQTNDNKAYIEWYFEDKMNWRLKGFQVLRADSLHGKYKVVVDKLPSTARDVSIKIDSIQNYYRVEAVPKDGKPVTSFPVFIIGQDTTPPLPPINFKGKCDTLGIVTLQWSPNSENDLWGYRLFKSNFKTDEFSAMNLIEKDTVFRDTINLNTNLEEIYYKIIAIDERNNRSVFKDFIIVKRPDLLPPLPGVLKQCVFNSNQIEVEIFKSSSHDVVKHRLFRKELSKEKEWTLISEFDTTVVELKYLDRKISDNTKYAYIVTAVDEANWESRPSQPIVVETKKIELQLAFKQVVGKVDKNKKEGVIEWSFVKPEQIKEIILYKGIEEKKISIYKIVESDKFNFTEKVKPGEKYFYYLCPVFKDDTYGRFSELITLSNE